MTPNEILKDAVARFVVCYIVDPEEQKRLLRQALGKFQDKAGLIREVWGEDAAFAFPQDFHGIAGCRDTKSRYIPWRIKKDAEGKPCGVSLVLNTRHAGFQFNNGNGILHACA